MSQCDICGKNKDVLYRWHRYGNGDQFRALVCDDCALKGEA
jgi:hypothetical protein